MCSEEEVSLRPKPAPLESLFSCFTPSAEDLEEIKFKGTTVVVTSEALCDQAVAQLRAAAAAADTPGAVIGFDTENIAHTSGYSDGLGVNSDKAAIAQCCASDDQCFIFSLHTWGADCYDSFKNLMSDPNVQKVQPTKLRSYTLISSLYLFVGGSEF